MRYLLSTATLACLLAGGQSLGATAYDNTDYGVHGEAPDGRVICRPGGDGSNHGYYVRLDRPNDAVDCDASPQGTVIEVYFAYNVVYEAASTESLAAHVCKRGRYKPSPFRIDGTKFARCVSEPAGTVEYVVLRPARRRLNTPDIELDITLTCPRRNCGSYESDLRQTIERLKTIPVSTEGAPTIDENGDEGPAK